MPEHDRKNSQNCSKTLSRPARDFLQRGKNTSLTDFVIFLMLPLSLFCGRDNISEC